MIEHPGPVKIEVIEAADPQQQDFSAFIPRLKAGNYDLLGIFLLGGKISLFYRQMAEQGFRIATVGTDFFESRQEIAAARGNMEGAVFANIAVSDRFNADYVARFGNDSQIAYAGQA